jgi:hypothetical protein
MNAAPDPTRGLIGRIGACLLVVMITVPLALLGDSWSWLVLVALAAAVIGLLSALKLRSLRRD